MAKLKVGDWLLLGKEQTIYEIVEQTEEYLKITAKVDIRQGKIITRYIFNRLMSIEDCASLIKSANHLKVLYGVNNV